MYIRLIIPHTQTPDIQTNLKGTCPETRWKFRKGIETFLKVNFLYAHTCRKMTYSTDDLTIKHRGWPKKGEAFLKTL